MQNPFQNFKKHDWVIWILSVIIVTTSNILTGEIQIFTLCATVIGVTALIFVAKGNVWGQILTVIFSILYAIASLQFQYYGEMIRQPAFRIELPVNSGNKEEEEREIRDLMLLPLEYIYSLVQL